MRWSDLDARRDRLTRGPVRVGSHPIRALPARYLRGRCYRLADLVGLDRSSTVIDIGCGTGQLTIPLAERAGTVIAVDPLAEMLEAGRARAMAQGLTNIRWLQGDSGGIESLVPLGAHLATFAASFHWTDRAEVLRSLDRMLGPGAHVVTINDDLDVSAEPDWVPAVGRLRDEFLGSDHTVGTDPWRKSPVSHRQIIDASPFAEVQSLHWEWERRLTVDEAVGLQFTYSYSTPAVFGPRGRVRQPSTGRDPRPPPGRNRHRTVPGGSPGRRPTVTGLSRLSEVLTRFPCRLTTKAQLHRPFPCSAAGGRSAVAVRRTVTALELVRRR